MKTKTEAIQRVIDNNRADYDKILAFAIDWVKNQFKAFTNEHLKYDYYSAGNEIPRNVNVYGAVITELSRRKLIFVNGTTTATTPQSHGRLLRKWISKEYSELQAHNRKNKPLPYNLFTQAS